MKKIIIGARGSQLSLAYAAKVKALILKKYLGRVAALVDIVVILFSLPPRQDDGCEDDVTVSAGNIVTEPEDKAPANNGIPSILELDLFLKD